MNTATAMNTQTITRIARQITDNEHSLLLAKLTPGTVSHQQHKIGLVLDPVILAMTALHTYAIAHKQRFESNLAEDYILGPHWLDAAKGIRGLLNGEGLFDAGTVESLFWSALEHAGFTEADL